MDIANDDRVYKTFMETYKILTFTMGVGMMYPNPRTEKKRIFCIFLIILSAGPLSLIMLDDMYRSWLRYDIVNVIRHCTIAGPFLAGFFKMIILFYKRTSAKEIIDEINMDYVSYNHMGSTYKNIISRSIANSLKYSEKMWTVVVITCVTAFPIMASLSTMYSYLFESEPQRYMIHDVMVPNTHPDKRFESPIFEIMFIYMLYACALFIINFVACDGFFGVSINHACLKMEIYCNAFEEALKEDNARKMYSRIVEVIIAQNKLKRFTDLIQDTFNIWLGLILVATMIQIGNCMYLISEGYGLDPRYIIFIVGTVAHIYLPCRYCAKLKYMSMETATLIYCAGWESVPSISIRKMILFMIARAQIPIEITAFNLMVFDMDLFVSIMNSSYSMFTLLRS